MKELNDDEIKYDARIVLLIVLGLSLIFLIAAFIILPSLIYLLLNPIQLYETGLSSSMCGSIAFLTTLGLLIFFTLVAGERLLDFNLETKLILAGFPVFFVWFWIVLAWLF